jgi:hypothetical protein
MIGLYPALADRFARTDEQRRDAVDRVEAMGRWRRCDAIAQRRARGVGPALALIGLLAACHAPAPAPTQPPRAPWAITPPSITMVAHAAIPTGRRLGALEVGGLSGLTYDAKDDVFYAIVDDPGKGPDARALRFRWHPPAEPELLDWLPLREHGRPLPALGADLEGIARLTDGRLFVSSEGNVKKGIGPWVGRFGGNGARERRLPLAAAYGLRAGHGPGQNQGFEALALEPDGEALIAGVESSLAQDLPTPAGELARTRLLRWDLRSRAKPQEWAYPIDAPHAKTTKADGLEVAGLVDVLPWQGHLLTLERSYVDGVGFAVKLFEATLDGAEEITGVDALGGRSVRTARKRLLADLGAMGVPMDNYEGMTWAPIGVDGGTVLVVVSDNNFNKLETTYLAAFEVRAGGDG